MIVGLCPYESSSFWVQQIKPTLISLCTYDNFRHYIPARTGARRVMARGAYPRAGVTRGTDWDYGDDDGEV